MSDLAIQVQAIDEGLHTPGPNDLWSESFYLDAVNADGNLGVYVRLGRTVNQGVSVYTAAICEKGQPAVMVVDQKAPLAPADDRKQYFKTKDIEVSFELVEPLKALRVTNKGLAASHVDHSEPLRGEAGNPVQATFDLTWHTDGTPFKWRGTTRYELPCRVKGTVTVGDKTFQFDGPGQRDHSWADRDWWTPVWTWTAFHLDDGTHIHAVRVPNYATAGEGYIQRGDEFQEMTSCESEWTKTDDGLVSAARVKVEPGGIDMKVIPQAFGALLLTRDDGRADDFPRAYAKVELTDGRTGWGWIEWNWPRPAPKK